MELHQQLALHLPELTERLVFHTDGAYTSSARRFLVEVNNLRVDIPYSMRTFHDVIQFMLAWLQPP